MLGAMRNASIGSTILALQNNPGTNTSSTLKPKFANHQLSLATLLYLATLGGAQVCAMEDQIGSFKTGKSFDALVVDVRDSYNGRTRGKGNPALWGVMSDLGLGESEGGGQAQAKKELDEMLGRFVFCGDDRNISAVYVQGRLIGGTSYGA